MAKQSILSIPAVPGNIIATGILSIPTARNSRIVKMSIDAYCPKQTIGTKVYRYPLSETTGFI